MGYYNDNIFDDTTWEFPRTGFWLVHIFGTILVFYLGMRFAMGRCPFSRLGHKFLRMLVR